eukprot:INCI648.8.p1 GENE.INCI648.8~~INCI648.8.p1  ORF type:complete len:493 (+),score=57.70 INCI648.8:101-1579(+)
MPAVFVAEGRRKWKWRRVFVFTIVAFVSSLPLSTQRPCSSAQPVPRVPCRSQFNIDANTGQWELKEGFLPRDTPLILEGCSDDSEVLHILREEFGPVPADWIKDVWKHLPVDLSGTGPFHLELGSSMLRMVPITSANLGLVLSHMQEQTFAFQTTPDNPAVSILELIEANLAPNQLEQDQVYKKLWKALATNLFSLGGHGSGAHFHNHEINLLFLVRGEKRWVMSPNNVVPPKSLTWASPRLWMKNSTEKDVDSQLLEDADDFCGRKEVFSATQRPGDIMVVPSWWYHATYNSGPELTIGFGAQKLHRDLFPQHQPEPGQSEYIQRYQSALNVKDFSLARREAQNLLRQAPSSAGAFLRLLMMTLHTGDVRGAKDVYDSFRQTVLDGTTRGWLRESDFDFVFRDHARNIIMQALEQLQDKSLAKEADVLTQWVHELDADTAARDVSASSHANVGSQTYPVAGFDGFYDVAEFRWVLVRRTLPVMQSGRLCPG